MQLYHFFATCYSASLVTGKELYGVFKFLNQHEWDENTNDEGRTEVSLYAEGQGYVHRDYMKVKIWLPKGWHGNEVMWQSGEGFQGRDNGRYTMDVQAADLYDDRRPRQEGDSWYFYIRNTAQKGEKNSFRIWKTITKDTKSISGMNETPSIVVSWDEVGQFKILNEQEFNTMSGGEAFETISVEDMGVPPEYTFTQLWLPPHWHDVSFVAWQGFTHVNEDNAPRVYGMPAGSLYEDRQPKKWNDEWSYVYIEKTRPEHWATIRIVERESGNHVDIDWDKKP